MKRTVLPGRPSSRGFTLVEVLVALTVVALGLTALMVAVSGTARTSGYLRDKTIAQWIALNRLTQVRLMVNRLGDNQDTGQIDFAGRKWHYDTRYFDTTFPSMKRVVVRVYPGEAKTKGNPIAESTSFLGSSLATPGMSNVDWTQGSTSVSAGGPCAGTNGTLTAAGTTGGTVAGNPLSGSNATSANINCTPGGAAGGSVGRGGTSGAANPQSQPTP